ncbi:hypothetical protein WR25_07496 [Diploscapter pachys]|uniref:Major facilitator superfamily associated domain-containing protein n=1 Tax=Diploscapter pachys TaxID=2018661 RepID=A0A2A2JKF2_9BILA|nr:hypothetical protein WR25_07496 [Diploscapter pachys]
MQPMEQAEGEEPKTSVRTVTFMGKTYSKDAFLCRLFYLSFFASFGSLFPLLAVYFKQLGMTSTQPITPYCIAKLEHVTNTTCQMRLVPAGNVIRGGALGMLKAVVVGGSKSKSKNRNRRKAENQISQFVDLSLYDKDTIIGISPEIITRDRVCNYDELEFGVLVSPPHSSRVYRQPAVEQAFMLLWLLIALGEFASSPALPLADAATLQAVKDTPREFGKIRLFASVGWGLAMFVMGIGLDYSDTFRNHPCPTADTTEKNYVLCFVMCSIFMVGALLLAMKLKFDEGTARPDEVHGLVMDTREHEVAHAVAEKARARQLQATGENSTFVAFKALASPHAVIYLLSVVTMGFGAGLIFSFLFWHLQDIGGSPVLFGILSVTNHTAEIISYFYTYKIINKFGHVRVMYMCLATNVVRFLILSVLDNPWMGVCLATTWATATSYISLISPPQVKSSSQYILQLSYNGLGRGVGSILGGWIISNVAPQGLPTTARDGKITDAFNTTSVMNSNYGAINQESDPQQDAYDRYVSSYQ